MRVFQRRAILCVPGSRARGAKPATRRHDERRARPLRFNNRSGAHGSSSPRSRCRASPPVTPVEAGGERTLLSVDEFLSKYRDQHVEGVYAVYAADKSVQYINHSHDVVFRVREHKAHISDAHCAFVYCENADSILARAPTSTLAKEAQRWIARQATPPPGNRPDDHLWTACGYESDDDITHEQAAVSPFSNASVHRQVGSAAGGGGGLTVANVNVVLDDIRGYLFADGGDIDVVKVEDGVVHVRFEGNCASCGSQETTMKMGVERSLKAAFGDKLKDVISVTPPETESTEPRPIGVEDVNSVLNLLRRAIDTYGGLVEVVSVENGVCNIRYEGPETIWLGVRAAIRDKYPELQAVERVEA